MREILFKAKRKDNGEWVHGFYMECRMVGSDGTDSCIVKLDGQLIVVDRDTLCQFTGLTDKNGNKIWENDIVKILREDDYFKVIWSDTEARYEMQSYSLVVDYDNYWSYESEVIGNTFDNPELLGG